MKKIIFDIAITGHHSEYIGHLVDYLYSQSNNDIYYFVVHTDFSKKFPEIASQAKSINNLTWIEIEPSESKSVSGGSLQRSFASYRIMNDYAKRFKVDHVCCLDFHILKYGCIFFRTSYTLSGIMFAQFYRLKKNSINEKWAYYKRYYLTKFGMLNKKITRIFVLNDVETTNFMNKEFNTDVYNTIPDPIPKFSPSPDFDIYAHYKIGAGRKIFLHIGSLGDRKGTLEVLDAVTYIEESYQDKIAILLVGKASSERERITISRKLSENQKVSPVQLVWDDNFVPTEIMKSLFDQCHAVLMPYKNADYSSGILGHAAASNKTVIATGDGLLKKIVLEHRLGLLLERPYAPEIAQKIKEALTYVNPSHERLKFVEEHDPVIFAKMVLES